MPPLPPRPPTPALTRSHVDRPVAYGAVGESDHLSVRAGCDRQLQPRRAIVRQAAKHTRDVSPSHLTTAAQK